MPRQRADESCKTCGGFRVTQGLVPRGNLLWTCEGGLKYLGFSVPVRMTILGYKSSPKQDKLDLLLVSPFPPLPEVVSAVQGLGTVTFILAPNYMHHLWAGDAKQAFPGSKLIGPEALAAKRKDLQFDVLLSTDSIGAASGAPPQPAPAGTSSSSTAGKAQEKGPAGAAAAAASPAAGDPGSISAPSSALPPDWPSSQIQLLPIAGIDLHEIAVYHAPSRSLVLTDTAFNFDREGDTPVPGWPFSWYLSLAGGYRRCCITKTIKFLVKDAGTVKASLRRVLDGWDFDQIIMAHGSVITQGGKAALTAGTYDFIDRLHAQREAAAAASGGKGAGAGAGTYSTAMLLTAGGAVAVAAVAAVALMRR